MCCGVRMLSVPLSLSFFFGTLTARRVEVGQIRRDILPDHGMLFIVSGVSSPAFSCYTLGRLVRYEVYISFVLSNTGYIVLSAALVPLGIPTKTSVEGWATCI